MDLTKKEIIEKMRIEMPYGLPFCIIPYIEEAMQIYADQEAKAYGNWLAYQKYAGKTAERMFKDYKAQFHDEPATPHTGQSNAV